MRRHMVEEQPDFRIHLLMYQMVNGSLGRGGVTGAGFVWPVFPIVSWGIAAAAAARDANSRDVPTETDNGSRQAFRRPLA